MPHGLVEFMFNWNYEKNIVLKSGQNRSLDAAASLHRFYSSLGHKLLFDFIDRRRWRGGRLTILASHLYIPTTGNSADIGTRGLKCKICKGIFYGGMDQTG